MRCTTALCSECITKLDGINHCRRCIEELAGNARKAQAPTHNKAASRVSGAVGLVVLSALTWLLLEVLLPGRGSL